jgi:polar amino acid transport system substrate-binding protein
VNLLTRTNISGAALALVASLASGQAQAAPAFKTVQPNQLTVAYRTDDKPVSFVDDKGNPSGYLVEFMNAIGDKLQLKVQYIATDFASMVPAVRNGRYDTAAFGTLVSPAREKVVSFTSPIGFSEARLVSRKDAAIEKIDGAKDKTVAITRGSELIPLLQKLTPGVTIREFPNIAASLNALLAKQVDGLFTGLNTAEDLVAKHGELTASQLVTTGHTAFPVSMDNPELLKEMNAAIAELMKDGTFTRIFVKWEPPSVPIPEELFTVYPGMPRREAASK